MSTFNPDKKELDKKMFGLYLVQHSQTKLYWDGKGFNQKDKKKAILADYRLMATLKWEHIHVVEELLVKNRLDDNCWLHLVPKLSACVA